MPETDTVALEEALSDDRLKDLAPKLAALPTADEFSSLVLTDLWGEFAGGIDSEYVWYNDLSDKSQSIFGWEKDTEEVPWWLKDFQWTARMGSGETRKVTLNSAESLAEFENFDPSQTKIERPQWHSTTTDIFEGFDKLKAKLNQELEPEFAGDTDFPATVFEIKPKRLQTTEEFREWVFECLIPLCPPYNETLTALFTANTNVGVEIVEEHYDDKFVEILIRLGYWSGKRVYCEEYDNGLGDILSYDSNRIFDCLIAHGENTSLGPFEAEFYRAQTVENETTEKWVDKAAKPDPAQLDKGEEDQFATIAFQAPLSLAYYADKFEAPKPRFSTLTINKTVSGESSGYGKNATKYTTVSELLEESE